MNEHGDPDPATAERHRRIDAATASAHPRCHWHLLRSGGLLGILCIGLAAAAAVLEIDEYLERASTARQRGDWQSVASQLAQAINHPEMPAGGQRRSAVLLAYAQAIGVHCHYEESEKYLLMAREIALAAGSPTFDADLELGALRTARRDFAGAVAVLEPLARSTESVGSSAPAPQRRALLHARLAEVLNALDRVQEATRQRDLAQALRAADPARGRSTEDGTAPYGSRCRAP